jgi:uncharacterized membrane protein
MKNMKWKFVLALSLAAAFFIGSARAEATITITVKNNRSHNLSMAFCLAGFDYGYDVSNGWYNVKAGESRTLTFKDAKYHFTAEGFGYYAKGTPQGGKTLYWKGKDGDEYMEFYIHPSKAFTGSHDDPIEGGQKVAFRKIKLTRIGDEDSENGKATITFNP